MLPIFKTPNMPPLPMGATIATGKDIKRINTFAESLQKVVGSPPQTSDPQPPVFYVLKNKGLFHFNLAFCDLTQAHMDYILAIKDQAPLAKQYGLAFSHETFNCQYTFGDQ